MDIDETILELIAPYEDDPALSALLRVSVGRVLSATVRNGDSLLPTATEVRHVVDWLRAAVARGEPWLDRVDRLGRPLKLMKFSRFADIVKEADKAMRHAIARGGISSDQAGQKVVEELQNGFRIVELLSKAALMRESSMMGHCVGNGGYDYVLSSDDETVLSLRDRHDKAHATIHVDRQLEGGRILQLRGKQNKRPIPTYLKIMEPFTQKFAVGKMEFGPLGFVVDTNGTRHELSALPDGIVVDGGLALDGTSLRVLPDGMTVRGDLDLRGSRIEELPPRLTVLGTLSASHSRLRKIPSCLRVEGDLCITNTGIDSIPNGLHIGGTLYMCKSKVRVIPADLSCGGIWFSHTEISKLPSGVVRGGTVNCSSTKVTELPVDLNVVSHLYMENTQIEVLAFDGSNLRCLFAGGSKLTELPATLGRMEYLDIWKTNVQRLPDGLMIEGHFKAAQSALKELPSGFAVGSLDVSGCSLNLPEGLEVKGTLSLCGSKISHLPEGTVVGGDVRAIGSSLETIGNGVTIKGDLIAPNSRLRSLPIDLKLGASSGRELDISHTQMTCLPDWNGACLRTLRIVGCSIWELPSGWHIDTIYAQKSRLKVIAGEVGDLHHTNKEALKVTGKVAAQIRVRGAIGQFFHAVSRASMRIFPVQGLQFSRLALRKPPTRTI